MLLLAKIPSGQTKCISRRLEDRCECKQQSVDFRKEVVQEFSVAFVEILVVYYRCKRRTT